MKLKNARVRAVLEEIDKALSLMREKPRKLAVGEKRYKILRESMDNEEKKAAPTWYPYQGVILVS
jgi:hypothetical protein